MMKYWRIWILVIMVIASVLAIGLKDYPYGRNGVEVSYVSDISPAKNILEQGMLITNLNGEKVDDVDDWKNKITEIKNQNVSIKVNGKTYEFYVNETFGVDVMEMERLNLEFGLDLRGGTRIILKPVESNVTEEDIIQIKSTLETRSNAYGLREINFYSVKGIDGSYYIQVEAAGIKKDIVDELLSTQGNFEAKILKPVELDGNTGTMQLGESSHAVTIVSNDTVKIDDIEVATAESFTLDGIDFQYINKTEENAFFMALVYSGDDIELVYSDPQHSGIIPQTNGFQFYFGVLVSEEGAQRFADVTTGISSYIDMNSGERYLDSSIYLYLDGKLVSELRISEDLGGKVYQSPQIQGFRESKEDAIEEKLKLQTILRSGALPVKLETVSVDIISPTLGTDFFSSAIFAAGFGALVVFLIVFFRYKKIKIAVPMVFVAFSEVLIILGIAATGDSLIWMIALLLNFMLITTAWWKKHEIDIYAWVGALLIPLIGMMSWTIDLPAIAGIIAVIGTGVDHQIIIADETIAGKKEKVYDLKEKIKRAFFIIFGAAATTIVAMVPLMSIGIGLVRGFAITTIIGVLVGVLVTRPAYARIVEGLVKK